MPEFALQPKQHDGPPPETKHIKPKAPVKPKEAHPAPPKHEAVLKDKIKHKEAPKAQAKPLPLAKLAAHKHSPKLNEVDHSHPKSKSTSHPKAVPPLMKVLHKQP